MNEQADGRTGGQVSHLPQPVVPSEPVTAPAETYVDDSRVGCPAGNSRLHFTPAPDNKHKPVRIFMPSSHSSLIRFSAFSVPAPALTPSTHSQQEAGTQVQETPPPMSCHQRTQPLKHLHHLRRVVRPLPVPYSLQPRYWPFERLIARGDTASNPPLCPMSPGQTLWLVGPQPPSGSEQMNPSLGPDRKDRGP